MQPVIARASAARRRCAVRAIGAWQRLVEASSARSEGARAAGRHAAAPRWGKLVTARVEPGRGALLAAPRRDNVRFGAAVYGSFLVASVVGVAFEAGQDARVMTTSAFGSALVFWLAHWWSEVIGEQISAGEAFRHRDVLVVARREWPLVEAAVVPTLLLALAWAGVWSRETGAELALAAAVLQITGWALVGRPSRRMDMATRRPLRRGRRSARHRATASREVGSLRHDARRRRFLSAWSRTATRPESRDASDAGYVTAVSPGFRPTTDAPAATSPRTTVGTTVRKR